MSILTCAGYPQSHIQNKGRHVRGTCLVLSMPCEGRRRQQRQPNLETSVGSMDTFVSHAPFTASGPPTVVAVTSLPTNTVYANTPSLPRLTQRHPIMVASLAQEISTSRSGISAACERMQCEAAEENMRLNDTVDQSDGIGVFLGIPSMCLIGHV